LYIEIANLIVQNVLASCVVTNQIIATVAQYDTWLVFIGLCSYPPVLSCSYSSPVCPLMYP